MKVSYTVRVPLLEASKTRYLLADGGISVTLRRMSGGETVAEQLNLSNPDLVLAMHEEFIEAGADCITTNTFAANATRQAPTDSGDIDAICRAGAKLARKAAGEDRYVLGSVGPWWQIGEGWEHSFEKQVRALADGGVDAICIETLISMEMARELLAIARHHDSGLPVFLSFVFEKRQAGMFRLPGDDAGLETVAQQIESLGAQGYGVNCGIGLDAFDYAELISKFREHTAAPILARPSAGDPKEDADGLESYPDSAEYMAEAVWGMVRAGANIIGGCCGVTPEHIRAFRSELDMLG